jgi:hypothetical protein
MIPRQNRIQHFTESVVHVQPKSNNSPSIFSYARSGRGVQGESVNSGSNPMYITSRRKYGGGF